jgi:hypothetical protein
MHFCAPHETAWQCGGQGFDPPQLHHFLVYESLICAALRVARFAVTRTTLRQLDRRTTPRNRQTRHGSQMSKASTEFTAPEQFTSPTNGRKSSTGTPVGVLELPQLARLRDWL